MKSIVWVLLLLLLPGVVLAGPVLVMPAEKITHQGWIPSGNRVKITFSVQNSGDSDLAILKVIPDCGCVAAYFDQVIAPGCQGRIDLVIDTAGLAGRIKSGPLSEPMTLKRKDL